jgi:hypothetical protein
MAAQTTRQDMTQSHTVCRHEATKLDESVPQVFNTIHKVLFTVHPEPGTLVSQNPEK